MDLIKEALSMGFADAAIMDTKDLVFVPEYRQFCEDNLCGNYNLVPACPPACGTVEEMQAKALKYEKALVLQTVLKDPIMDPVLFKQAKHAQNILTEQLARQMQETVTVYSPTASAFPKGSLYSFVLNGSTAVSSASVRITFPFFASVTLQSKVSVFTKRFLLSTFTVSAVTSAVIF